MESKDEIKDKIHETKKLLVIGNNYECVYRTVYIGSEVLWGGSRIERNCLFIVVIRKWGGWQRRGCVSRCLR